MRLLQCNITKFELKCLLAARDRCVTETARINYNRISQWYFCVTFCEHCTHNAERKNAQRIEFVALCARSPIMQLSAFITCAMLSFVIHFFCHRRRSTVINGFVLRLFFSLSSLHYTAWLSSKHNQHFRLHDGKTRCVCVCNAFSTVRNRRAAIVNFRLFNSILSLYYPVGLRTFPPIQMCVKFIEQYLEYAFFCNILYV